MSIVEPTPVTQAGNPYVGPRPFEEHEQSLFFGRDWEADELIALIIAHPLVLFYAESGAGKSSLLNARISPKLQAEEACEVLPVARVRGDIPTDIQARQIDNLYVFNTLLNWTEETEVTPAQLVHLSLAEFLKSLPHQNDREDYPALRILVFDQFEELFTFYPERWPEREKFFTQINEALAGDTLLRVLFVIREDYVTRLDPYAQLLPEQLRSRFRLERLRREAALTAVTGPLQKTGRAFTPGMAESLVDELLKIRVEDRSGQLIEAPGEFVEPVQLQVVCQSLWNGLPPEVAEITQNHLLAFGNVDQALTRFYEQAIQNTLQQFQMWLKSERKQPQIKPETSFGTPYRVPYQGLIHSWLNFLGEKLVWESPIQQTLFLEWGLRNWFERELITPAGTRGLVYRSVKGTGGVPNMAVDLLESQHLIRGEQRAGGRWYELTHDRLIRPIQKANANWQTKILKKGGLLLGGVLGLVALVLLSNSIIAWNANARAAQAEQAAQATAMAAEQAQFQARATAQGAEAVIAQVAGVEATSTAAAQTIRKDRIRPLRPGLSIGLAGTEDVGTLGYFVVDKAGQTYLLTTRRLWDNSTSHSRAAVMQPAPFDGGRLLDVIGSSVRMLPQEATMPAAYRVALVRLEPNIHLRTVIPEIGPIRGIRKPEVGMKVRKLGRTTGFTWGIIAAVGRKISITIGEEEIQLTQAISASLVSSGGDEGALVVDEEGYAVGVIVNSSGQETFLASLSDVFTNFEVELLTPPSMVESPYLYGLNDRGGERLMVVDGQAKGWVLITEDIGADSNDQSGSDYTDLAYRGFGVMVQLNYADGPAGVIPLPDQYQDFARRAANFVANSSGANIWIIGSEMNAEHNWPRLRNQTQAEPITPRQYAECYQLVRDAIHRVHRRENDQVIVGAIAPWNSETPYEADPEGKYPANKIEGASPDYPYYNFWGDFIIYLGDVLRAIGPGNVDGIALHAYSHGYDPNLVFDDAKMSWPFEQYYYHFRTYRDQMEVIPPEFRNLPVYLTEIHGGTDSWPDVNSGWIKNAYQEIDEWNQTGHQPIRAVLLYRWSVADSWSIENKSNIQQDFREAITRNYRWRPVTSP